MFVTNLMIMTSAGFRRAVIFATFAAGCSGAGGDAGRMDTTQPVRAPDTAAAFGHRTDPDTAGLFTGTTGRTARPNNTAPIAILHAVRTARHSGYERVVFEFRDNRHPGYTVEYLDHPAIACGSGDTVTVAGGARLEVRMSPSDAHAANGERVRSTIPQRRLQPGYPMLRELTLTCDFEANVTWVLGLAARQPYRVLELDNPARIVVDVRDASGGPVR